MSETHAAALVASEATLESASVARIRGDVQPRHRPCSDLVALPKRNRFAELKAAVTVLWAGEPRA